MKLNAGIITPHLAETEKFYTEQLGFGVRFKNEWYLLLHTPDGSHDIAFLQPELDNQAPVFRPAFQGQGVFLTIEVDDVQALYDRFKERGLPMAIDLKKEAWGDTHFAITDPNGIGIDFVHYEAPPEN